MEGYLNFVSKQTVDFMKFNWEGVMPAVFTWLKASKSGALEIDFDATQKQAAGILKVQGKGRKQNERTCGFRNFG